MKLDEAAGNAQPDAAGGRGLGCGGAKTGAIVEDLEENPIAGSRMGCVCRNAANSQYNTLVRVLNRIAQEVLQDAQDALTIAVEGERTSARLPQVQVQ